MSPDFKTHLVRYSDYPSITYTGSNTVELTFRKTASDRGMIDITLYTPKGPIKRSGEVTGDIQMDTCP